MSLRSAANLAEAFAVVKRDNVYHGQHLPGALGSDSKVEYAYGGYAIATGIQSAYLEATESFRLFSVLGNFLRPARTDAPLKCKVAQIRGTQSFVTYNATVYQMESSGGQRTVAQMTLDFHVPEPSMLTYSPSPVLRYSSWSDYLQWDELIENGVRQGRISRVQADTYQKLFGASRGLVDVRPCTEGVAAQNLMGILKSAESTQEERAPSSKTSADWFRTHCPLSTTSENAAGLGFITDGILAFLPLTHNHLFLDDTTACSSLDFALRLFTPHLNLNDWHLRELVSHCSSAGRSYGETRVWNAQGDMVAAMTQQCILRPRKIGNKI